MSKHDVIVIGGGMGGLTAATLFAHDQRKVVLLEAAHAIGGCSSSYFRKGYIFESGATTLIGFDAHQPLARLEALTGIRIPRERLTPSMTVHQNGTTITRHEDREMWIEEAIRHFGQPDAQRAFWKEAYSTADMVWELSERNPFFPPKSVIDIFRLVSNHPKHALALRFAKISVLDRMIKHGLTSPSFKQFVDEQLMISAQAPSQDVPFLFGAPALTYTNSGNYSVPGGLIEMANTLQAHIRSKGGEVFVKHKVVAIEQIAGGHRVTCKNGKEFEAKVVIANLPVWNMEALTDGAASNYFKKEAKKYDVGWGAFTMGVVTDDVYPDELTLHHQIHSDEPLPICGSHSIFVSFSQRGDTLRAPDGSRVLNISTHTPTEPWFDIDDATYDERKGDVTERVLELMRLHLPGFVDANVKLATSATPSSWESWVGRHKGRVGGIPQSMDRALWDWTPNETPFPGLYLCGDTTYPGQGIPGVTLGGINVYLRAKRTHFR